MKRWYNGFRFSPEVETTVYNPVSVALTLAKKERSGFKATWATTSITPCGLLGPAGS